jgi:molybdopterin-containing oxidoreductase family membrane subunit
MTDDATQADRPILAPSQSYARVTEQIAGIPVHYPAQRNWWIGFGISAALLLLFVVALTVLFYWGVGVWGINIPVNWGFAILNYVWWLGLGHAGTLISALLLLLGQEWRNSLNRFAEAMTLFAVTCAGIYPIIHLGRPWLFYWIIPYPSTMDVWPQFRSPLAWDLFAVLTYLTVSVLFWYIGIIPDLGAARDRTQRRGWQIFFGIFALGWRGSATHWARWRQCYLMVAALAVPLVVSVHSEVSLLFAVGLLPGWHSTVFPPYFVMGAAFSGFAVVAMIAIVLRSALKLGNLVTLRHLDLLGQMVLAIGLMTAYGYVAEIFFTLYGGGSHELQTLQDRLVGEFSWAYWGAVVLNFVPLQALWFAAVRRSPVGLFLVSLSATVGMWFERFMIVVTGLYRDFLVSSWGHYTPSFWEWATFIGTLGLFFTLLFLFVRFLPVISAFEVKEVLHEVREEEVRSHG